jgi:hypothetical protein
MLPNETRFCAKRGKEVGGSEEEPVYEQLLLLLLLFPLPHSLGVHGAMSEIEAD